MSETASWPTEIRIATDRRNLTIAFDDGEVLTIPAELLRVRSPSAEVQGHGAGQRKTVPGKRNVMIIGAEAVGAYAVRLRFDDLHDTGIYPWALLRDMGRRASSLMAEYEAELAAAGLSR